MPNTLTQIHIQVVFAVQNRQSLISQSWEHLLYRYITGIIQNQGHKLLAINGMPDHVHILLGLRPTQSLSDLMRDVKSESSLWVNQQDFTTADFRWQEGYGAFSYSKSDLHKVVAYILNQKQHHQQKSFTEEYINLLNEFEIEFDERYVFKPVSD